MIDCEIRLCRFDTFNFCRTKQNIFSVYIECREEIHFVRRQVDTQLAATLSQSRTREEEAERLDSLTSLAATLGLAFTSKVVRPLLETAAH